jgi:hypothetical protein
MARLVFIAAGLAVALVACDPELSRPEQTTPPPATLESTPLPEGVCLPEDASEWTVGASCAPTGDFFTCGGASGYAYACEGDGVRPDVEGCVALRRDVGRGEVDAVTICPTELCTRYAKDDDACGAAEDAYACSATSTVRPGATCRPIGMWQTVTAVGPEVCCPR